MTPPLEPAADRPNPRRRRMARNSALAAGLVGGLTVVGITTLGPGAATASPAAKPATAKAPALSPAVAKQLAQQLAAKKAAGQKGGASPVTADPDQPALDAYFNAGYDYDDAVALAKMWNSSDPFAAKVAAGRKLENGEKLPLAPGSAQPAQETAADTSVSTFFAKGYDYDDAVQLAQIWHLATAYDAKVAGGKKLESGETLPIQP